MNVIVLVADTWQFNYLGCFGEVKYFRGQEFDHYRNIPRYGR